MGSRASQILLPALIWTSRKQYPNVRRASVRSACRGEILATSTTMPASAIMRATTVALRMLLLRYSGEKPRSGDSLARSVLPDAA